MPVFRTSPQASLPDAIRNLMGSGGSDLSPLQMMQADSMAANTAQHTALARKAQMEVEAMQRAQKEAEAARANLPATQTAFASDYAGINHDLGANLRKHVTGTRERPLIELDEEGNRMPDVTYAVPAGVSEGQVRLFRNALATLGAAQLGGGKSDAKNMAEAAGHIQTNGIVQGVQDAIARGDYKNASAMSQGAKPGTPIKLVDNIGDTGALFEESTGKTIADVNSPILQGTLAKNKAQMARDNAAAGASTAHADLFRAQADSERKKPPKAADFKDVTTLRKEFDDRPEVKQFRDVMPIIESARSSPDTRSGDIQMAYAVGKILDPNSVVREGELKLVGDAATIDERVKGELRSLVMGKGRLTPATRAQLVAMLDNAVNNREAAYKRAEDIYRGIAQQNGFDLGQVITQPLKRNIVQDVKPTGQTNAKGWKLMTDAAGNKAYVSPDGKQFEEVK